MAIRFYLRWPAMLAMFLALALAGGPGGGLQVVAWGGMLASRLASRPAAEALRSTFDGSEPCCLCKASQALRESPGPAVSCAPQDPLPSLIVTHAPPMAEPVHLLMVLPIWAAVAIVHHRDGLARPAQVVIDVPTPPPRHRGC